MKRLIASVVILSLAPSLIQAEDVATSRDVQIETIGVGTAVENKELTGTATEFYSSISRVYCWTKVTTVNSPTKIQHIWYANDQKEAEVPLDIKYPTVRTWSSKNVWPGKWKVDIADEAGMVLSSIEFTVKGHGEQSSQ